MIAMQHLVTVLLFGFLVISQIVASQKHVIVAVGSTGMGKSTMAKYLTGSKKVVVGHTHKSETRNTAMYDSDKFTFIDTPGFGDTDTEKYPDKQVKVEILQFFHDNGIKSFNTIMWFCNPNVRSGATLQKQAKFIKSFEERGSSNSIWKNVIIIIKAGVDSQGPLGTVDGEFKPIARSLYIMDENEEYMEYGEYLKDRRVGKGYLRGSELQEWVKQLINDEGHGKSPYKITFYKDRCKKCGLEADHRLMGNKPCHDILTKVHKGNPESVHTGHLESYHPGHYYEKGNAGLLAIPIFGPLAYEGSKKNFYTCCGREIGSSGCANKYSCCGRSAGQEGCASRYSGCLCSRNAEGCTPVCRDCSKKYGTPGCGMKYTHEIELSIEAKKKPRDEL